MKPNTNKNKNKKLQLKRDTLKILNAKEASSVQGGIEPAQGGGPTTSGAMTCYTTMPMQPPASV